jgi:hypothetical protein
MRESYRSLNFSNGFCIWRTGRFERDRLGMLGMLGMQAMRSGWMVAVQRSQSPSFTEGVGGTVGNP